MLNTLDQLDLRDARVLVRVDFNVPLADDGSVADDTRIRAALPTLRELLDRNCACVLMTHLGRPGGEPCEDLSLAPVADRLAQLLEQRELRRCDEVVGARAKKMAGALGGGEVLVLENLRFHQGETRDDDELASELASLGEFYVNDAFAACHRKHASVHALAQQFGPRERAMGRLLEREIEALATLVNSPQRPFVAIFGGAKVEDKLEVVRALSGRVDRILIGGAMAYTFMRARGEEIGASKLAQDQLDAAKQVLELAGSKLILPSDHVMREQGERERTRVDEHLAEGWVGLDIGPNTASRYASEIANASTVVWNGPMGKFEDASFRAGTRRVCEAMASARATTIVGGGETGAAVQQLGLEQQLTHLSTGGGAFLDYIAHATLPALEVLRAD